MENKKYIPDPITINVISESNFSIKEQGVHSAFLHCVSSLKKLGHNVIVNSFSPYDIVHIHNVGPLSIFFLMKKKKPRVISAHMSADSLIDSIVGAKFLFPAIKRYFIWLYNQADLVLAVSPSTYKTLQSYSLSSTLIMHSNAIDINGYKKDFINKDDLRDSLSLPKDKKIIMCCGQVQARKGIESFIDVAKSLPQYHFVWVGGILFGPLSDKSRDMNSIIKRKYNNITFTKTIPRDKVRDYYFAVDMFWLPSYQETFGLVVVEAAASGLPILLRDIDDYNDSFRPYAMMAKDNSGFTESIKNLLENLSTYDKYKNLSHKLALKYDSKTSGIRLSQYYRELITKYGNG
jgi:glycosyltransferase involved in cell wall biosynthesis